MTVRYEELLLMVQKSGLQVVMEHAVSMFFIRLHIQSVSQLPAGFLISSVCALARPFLTNTDFVSRFVGIGVWFVSWIQIWSHSQTHRTGSVYYTFWGLQGHMFPTTCYQVPFFQKISMEIMPRFWSGPPSDDCGNRIWCSVMLYVLEISQTLPTVPFLNLAALEPLKNDGWKIRVLFGRAIFQWSNGPVCLEMILMFLLDTSVQVLDLIQGYSWASHWVSGVKKSLPRILYPTSLGGASSKPNPF